MNTTTAKIGIIAAPGVTEKIARNLEIELPNILSERYDHSVKWEIDTIIDPLTGSAESIQQIFSKIADYQEHNHWHFTIGLTDLPMIEQQKVVAFDINRQNGASLISIPAYGWRPIKKRIQNSILAILTAIDEFKRSEKSNNNEHAMPLMNAQFPLTNLQSRTVYFENTTSQHTQYYVSSRSKGIFRLVSGMTFANNPFNMLKSLSNVVAIAFTTGAFGIIFTTMWNLSFVYSEWRLLLMMLVAIFGMMIWMIIAHNLWESKKESTNKQITTLYNLTTTMTLTVSVMIYYVILFSLFLVASLIVLPSDYLGQALQFKTSASLITYINLAWFAASISTVAGAIGVGLNNETLILESTYGYRQKQRYKQLHKEQQQQEQQQRKAQADIQEKRQEEEQKVRKQQDSN
ncbi:5,10-methylene-tetrahydrofolate dehydrogenase [Staphylococcus sp. GDB9P120P]|uniref:5,10-methylene-tetrahydrofolate dehydrogenase n=1 Tax=Staphylococcus sp. GDB9P120P TaxID=2804084 RepID=UPI001AEC031F|nr:5,10-methylene-tetrahydrofolate dehydrogenase [Staphylococcus sp. GDB9P120P]